MKWNDIIFARTKIEDDRKFYAGASLGAIKKERDLFGDPREMEIISMSDIPQSRSRALMCLYQEVAKDGLDLYNGARLLLPPDVSDCTNEDECDEYKIAKEKGCVYKKDCKGNVRQKCAYINCEDLANGKCDYDTCSRYIPKSNECANAHRCEDYKVDYLDVCNNCKHVKELPVPTVIDKAIR